MDAHIGNDCASELHATIAAVENRRDWAKLSAISQFVHEQYVLAAVTQARQRIRPWFLGPGNNRIKGRVKLSKAMSFADLHEAVDELT